MGSGFACVDEAIERQNVYEQAYYDGEFAKMTDQDLAAEVQSINAEIEGLPYLSLRYNIRDMRTELVRKLGFVQREIERRSKA